jgi:prepilin-type N-terminal cleavage/methylation domain-containing protein
MFYRDKQSGFTMIEVALVISIISVLAAIGWGSTRQQMPRYRLIQASKQLKSDLVHLRNLAVQTNRETRLTLEASPGDCDEIDDYGGQWSLFAGDRSRQSASWEYLPIDTESDGSDDERGEGSVVLDEGGNRQARDVCLNDWGIIRGPGSGSANSIVFSPRGWLTNPATDFNAQGYMELVLTNQAAARDGVEDKVKVLVTRAGMVRLHSTLGHAMSDNPVGVGGTSKAR